MTNRQYAPQPYLAMTQDNHPEDMTRCEVLESNELATWCPREELERFIVDHPTEARRIRVWKRAIWVQEHEEKH